ncbi:MAG TPA: sugar transferase [Lentimicrobium sp.]|nr:sugar transferase [Lentimicrobium sp.]
MVREIERQTGRVSGIIISILSLLTFIGSFNITTYFYDGFLSYSNEYLIIAFLIIPLWYIGIIQSSLTQFNNKSYFTIVFETGLFVITGTGFLALTQVAFNLTQVNNYVILTFAILDFFLINLILLLSYRYNKSMAAKGINIENIVVIADSSSVDFIEKIIQNNNWGYNINTIISDSPIVDEIFGSRIRIIEDLSSLSYILRQEVIDEVLYCRNKIDQDEIKELIYTCEEIGVVFKMQSSFFHMSSTKTNLTYYEDTPFLTFSNTPSVKFSHNWKLLLDILASVFILLIWSPIILIIAFAIKITSKGPVIFKQKRVGLRGRTFEIYKFRTMVVDAEKQRHLLETKNEMDGPVFKIKDDPRVTKIGKFLRKTGLDEIPQFFNVLNGDMSLVGPRPPLPSEVKQYERWQLRRLSMRPGITCIWQIAPNRNNISFNEWMKLDLQYIDSWSLKLDLILLFKTVQTVIKGSGQ